MSATAPAHLSVTPLPAASPVTTDALMDQLRAAGAPQWDAVGWHYTQVLAERARTQTGQARALLELKLVQALEALQARMQAASNPAPSAPRQTAASPLADLLRDMGHNSQLGGKLSESPSLAGRPESQRVRQFRQQLSKISLQKQVSAAIAQAPQNAGPINSHMLVLRALGLMRDASPDYLNRLMVYLDTLLFLDEAEKTRLAPKKSTHANKTAKASQS